MTDRSRTLVNQYVKSWQPATPSKRYFTDFAGGGVLWVGSTHRWHIFSVSGTWVAPVTNADVIVIGGGGGGDQGAGGAGGLRNLIAATFVIGTTYTVTVGAAGTNGTTTTKGGNSSITTSGATITATGGGKGQSSVGGAAGIGGSGGGAFSTGTVAGAAGNEGGFTPVEGFAGSGSGDACSPAPYGPYGKGGGGGGSSSAATAARTYWNTAARNMDSGGVGGHGTALPQDLIDAPFFDTFKANFQGTASCYVCQGGMGAGYYTVNSLYAVPDQEWQGSTNIPRLGFGSGDGRDGIGFGHGGSANATKGGRATGGLVVIRYAL